MMRARTARIRRDLTHEPEAQLLLWLAVGAHAAANPSLPDAVRQAAAEQAAVCHDLLVQRTRSRGDLPASPSADPPSDGDAAPA